MNWPLNIVGVRNIFYSIHKRICAIIHSKKMSTKLNGELLKPPSSLNMQVLNRDHFKKNITVPYLEVDHKIANKAGAILKSFLLKLPKLRPTITGDSVKFLLNPRKIKKLTDFDEKTLMKLADIEVGQKNLGETTVELNYENWNADEIMRSILPVHLPIARSFSLIGHILHLNLRDNLMDYKKIIGEILLDKTPNVKTVVNKTTNIDNTFRNFSMELICGEDRMVTQVKENGISFEFDFSKVYWNPRLSTEHQRVVDSLHEGDILFDVFCGVGPFAIPCAKKKCKVYANDLNPDSYYWLNHNAKINKIGNNLQTFNKDGRLFILEDIKNILPTVLKNCKSIHATMNLPAMALEFVKFFKHLWTNAEIDSNSLALKIHTYFFVLGDDPEGQARVDFSAASGLEFDFSTMSYQFVRNVSPGKNMVKISWTPPKHFLVKSIESLSDDDPPCKKMRDV